MKRVYSSLNSLLVDNLYNVLQQEDVPCEIRNRHGSSMMGEIPISEAFTELWVDESHAERANTLIEKALHESEQSPGEPWTCPKCGTEVEATFDTCWHCASHGGDRERADADEPIFGGAERSLSGKTIYIVWAVVVTLGLWWITTQ